MYAISQAKLRESKIFSSLLKAQNLYSSRGLVKISASCLSVLTCHKAISPLASWSRKKWCLISMCFVLECCTGLFASLIELSLSHKSGILLTHNRSHSRYASSTKVGHNKHPLPHIRLRRWIKLPNYVSWNSKILGNGQGIDTSPLYSFDLLCNRHNPNRNSQVDRKWSLWDTTSQG